jgi:hypothetical protein
MGFPLTSPYLSPSSCHTFKLLVSNCSVHSDRKMNCWNCHLKNAAETSFWIAPTTTTTTTSGRLLKCDGTRAETRFRLSAKRTSPFKSAVSVSSVDYWQASCAHQPAGFVLLVQTCVLQSCDAYWLPTPFSCFLFTSPPVRHRVPSHFKWILSLILVHWP